MERTPIREFQMIEILDHVINNNDFYVKKLSYLHLDLAISGAFMGRNNLTIYEQNILCMYYFYNLAIEETISKKAYFDFWWEEKIITDLFIYLYPDQITKDHEWYDPKDTHDQCFDIIKKCCIYQLRQLKREYYYSATDLSIQSNMLIGTEFISPAKHILDATLKRFSQINELLEDLLVYLSNDIKRPYYIEFKKKQGR